MILDNCSSVTQLWDLVIQWLRLHSSGAEDANTIPGQVSVHWASLMVQPVKNLPAM